MEYKNVVEDFVARTRQNLNYVREAALVCPGHEETGPAVYEFTQLVNSMLGLLVFPQQRFFDNIPETPLVELEKTGWPAIRVSEGFPDKVDNLKALMRYLRNAIAHFNIEFLTQFSQLCGVRVWNRRRGKRTLQADLSVETLEQITDRFIEIILADAQTSTHSTDGHEGGGGSRD